MKNALISCSNKDGLEALSNALVDANYAILSTGGTYKALEGILPPNSGLQQVSEYTDSDEILGGRVKTLHPMIHGGLLADRSNPDHLRQLQERGIVPIDVLVVNLYPFWEVTKETSEEEAIEKIDIGGVALLRAAAKNYKSVTILSSPDQYASFIANGCQTTEEQRKQLALKAFHATCRYDASISEWLSDGSIVTRTFEKSVPLKYGCNPQQLPAAVWSTDGVSSPLRLLNGDWGYINVLDAMGCWGLVSELSSVTGLVSACSMKHTSPAGAAVAVEWDTLSPSAQTLLSELYGVDGNSSPAANAYARARNADPLSSFGDFIGISCVVDESLARLIKRFVSDGIVAPGYTPEALEILRSKKGGRYVIVEADEIGVTGKQLYREMGGGLAVSQPANTAVVTEADLRHTVVSSGPALTDAAVRDLIVANVALKYGQSNNVCCAMDGQVIGLSAGQQSRVHSAKLAVSKARTFILRHYPASIAALKALPKAFTTQSRINATTTMVDDPKSFQQSYLEMIDGSETDRIRSFLMDVENYQVCGPEQSSQGAICMASDAFFPFPDSIEVAANLGVRYISQPGGSVRDKEVIEACSERNVTMCFTGKRLFTH